METHTQGKFGDVRDDTYKNRVGIGFSGTERWRDAEALFDTHTLTIEGHPVMEDWEDPYMQELAHIATMNGGTILEIGFGLGISAQHIQRYPIDSHIIIEANRDVFHVLERFSLKAVQPVTPLFGFWEDITKGIPSGTIDGILFDTYPLCEEYIHTNHFPFFTEAYRLLRPGGILTYYSDEINEYSPTHRAALQAAGFTQIDKRICAVTPPKECSYWKSDTILAPLIWK